MLNNKKLESIYNFRDISMIDSNRIISGKIFRCATPSEATKNDSEYILNKLKIKTIIDLRNIEESKQDIGKNLIRNSCHVLMEPDVYKQHIIEQLRKQHKRLLFQLPILPSNKAFLNELSKEDKAKIIFWGVLGQKKKVDSIIVDMLVKLKLQGLYRLILKNSWRNLCRTLELCLDPCNYPILIHCTQGKDRTGIVIFLILFCCNIPLELIVKDYHQSEEELQPLRNNSEYMQRNFSRATGLGLDMSSWMLAPTQALELTLQWINNNYGSVQKYLENIGFGKERQLQIKKLLIHPSFIPPCNIEVIPFFSIEEITLKKNKFFFWKKQNENEELKK